MAKRFVIRVDVNEQTAKQIEQACEHNGMTHQSINSRLVEWLAAQPQLIQAIVLDRFGKQLQHTAGRHILRYMAGEPADIIVKEILVALDSQGVRPGGRRRGRKAN
jgi:hypothetical protein